MTQKGKEKMKKRGIVPVLLCILTMLLMAGCAPGKQTGSEEKSISVVATIFPEYDWVNNLIGENPGNIDLKLLIENGADLHSYQPSVDDILTIETCDLFIYVGGESDNWVKDVLANAKNPDMKVINLLDVLGDEVKEEEIVEGMEAEEEEGEGEEEAEADEHVWLSLRNAQKFCDVIADSLCSVDPENEANYKANLTSYKEKLSALDEEYQNVCDAATLKTVLFGDRFPFRYLTEDYGLTYYAAFVGCSAETEASFKTIIFLAEKTDELSLPVILTIEGGNGKIAASVRDNTKEKNQEILTMHSMQSVTTKDMQDGVTYVSLMEENLEVLKKALH